MVINSVTYFKLSHTTNLYYGLIIQIIYLF